jgi:hypothetical protein
MHRNRARAADEQLQQRDSGGRARVADSRLAAEDEDDVLSSGSPDCSPIEDPAADNALLRAWFERAAD